MDCPSYDVVVIGAGPAGSSAALIAAAYGKRAALIEMAAHVGGAGINTGTIPSKTLRENALVIAGGRARALACIEVRVKPQATLASLTQQLDAVEQAMRREWDARLQQREVTVLRGRARFTDAHTVEIAAPGGGRSRVAGGKFVIATGSSPARPPGFDFTHPRVHDSNEILQITELPRSLAVVGAGVIGAEYACTFATLGVEVHVIDGRDALLPFLDRDISGAIHEAMTRAGIHFHWQERVVSCTTPPTGDVTVELASGTRLAVTDVLVAAGRSSNTDGLGIENTGIVLGKRGLVPVNTWYQTEVPHIYASGDVVGPPALAATSMEQARVAVCHAFDLMKKELPPLLPTGIYTIPEAGTVGATEQELIAAGTPYVVGRAPYRHNPRGRIIGDQQGLLKLLYHRLDNRLLGVHVVGEQATELVHIGMMAMLCGCTDDIFARACFNYPTLGDLYKHATYDALMARRDDIKKLTLPV
jgi:NAD(P) transhydrogenase